MPLRRRIRQVLLELVGAVATRAAHLARRIGLHPDRLIVEGSAHTSGAVSFTPLRAPVPLTPGEPVYVDEQSARTNDYRAMHADWGGDTTLPAGIVTAHDVDVSMPTGLHRWRNRVFGEGLLGREALSNPKYLAAFVAMMVVGSTELTEGVLLGLPWNHNFYHWLVEMLPRLQLVEESPQLQGVPLLVPASAPAFVSDSLRLSGFKERVTHLEDGVYRVGTLHIPSPLSPASDVSPDAVRWLDERFPRRSSTGRRIYVSRRDSPVRYVSNDGDVNTLLEQEYGFDTVVMSQLSLEEQICTFREADVIVGAHGAAFAHLAFAPHGAAFLELFQQGHFNHCYGRLAAIRDVRYGFLVGERDGFGSRVDLDSLRSVVGRIVRDAEPPRRSAPTLLAR